MNNTIQNVTLNKVFKNNVLEIQYDNDSSFAYDCLIDNLKDEASELKNIFYIINKHTRYFLNIFGNIKNQKYVTCYDILTMQGLKPSKYDIVNNFEFNLQDIIDDNEYELDEDEQKYKKTIAKIYDMIKIKDIACCGYSQNDWDDYLIVYIGELPENSLDNIKHIFTTQDLNVRYYAEYEVLISDINDKSKIIKRYIEEEDLQDNINFTLYGDEKHDDIIKNIKADLGISDESEYITKGDFF